MAKTLCKLILVKGSVFYLLQDEQNNISVSENQEDTTVSSKNVAVVIDNNNELGDNPGANLLSANNIYFLCNGLKFDSIRHLLEKGLKIPQHQMPNLPVGHGPQMHNIVPVFNPQNQQNNNISENVKVQHNNGQQNFYYSPQESVYGSVHNHLNNYINTDCKIF